MYLDGNFQLSFVTSDFPIFEIAEYFTHVEGRKWTQVTNNVLGQKASKGILTGDRNLHGNISFNALDIIVVTSTEFIVNQIILQPKC